MTDVTHGGIVEQRSLFDFAETVRRLEQAIASRGVPVFARIDHAANAEAVGLTMPPTLVIVFGNAHAGTPLMRLMPALALDLPLRILVREDDGGVVISYHDPATVVVAFGLPAEAAQPLHAVEIIAAEAAGQ